MTSRSRASSRRGASIRTIALVAMLGLGVHACATPLRSAPPAPGGTTGKQNAGAAQDRLDPQQERDLAFFTAILSNPANDAQTRAEAAERLLEMSLPESIRVLADALRSGDGSTMNPVIKAMGSLPSPVPALLDPAVDALAVAPEETLDPLAIVLSKYGTAALDRVSETALDRSRPPAERLGAVRALGSFPTTTSGDRLLMLADPRLEEEPAVRVAALDSLRRLAPADLGPDYAAWRAWWDEVRDKSPEEWSRELVRQYQQRNAALEQELGALAQRHVELLRVLYRTLEVTPGQLGRLPNDLVDPLPQVRAFALGRVARLLRDSVLIPDPIRVKLLAALDDDVPALRLEAAQLLDELDHADLELLIAERLPDVRDHDLAAGLLALLMRRPTAAAIEPILVRLADDRLCPEAAAALWALFETNAIEIEADRTEAARLAVRVALDAHPSPALAGLLVLIGDDVDVAEGVAMLDGGDDLVRAQIARALARRGLEEPLLARAGDPILYPYAVEVLAEGSPTLDNFRRLVAQAPPAGAEDTWAEGVRTLAGRLRLPDLVEADDILVGSAYATPGLRQLVLMRGALPPPDAMEVADRIAVLERLAPVLIELGEPLRAFELLDSLNGIEAFPSLVEPKFQSALLAARFEAAVLIHPDAGPWVAVLGGIVDQDAEAAVRLRDEIVQRFEGRLTDAERSDVEAASRRLPPLAAAPDDASDTSNQ